MDKKKTNLVVFEIKKMSKDQWLTETSGGCSCKVHRQTRPQAAAELVELMQYPGDGRKHFKPKKQTEGGYFRADLSTP